jgi:hypothetical protein
MLAYIPAPWILWVFLWVVEIKHQMAGLYTLLIPRDPPMEKSVEDVKN